MTTKPAKGGAAASAKGLVLTLGGAPNTWHTVDGYDGLFHPVHPVLIEDIGLDLERAQKAHDKPGTCLELVDVDDPDAARENYAEAIRGSRRAVRDAIDDGRMTTVEDQDQARAELDAPAPPATTDSEG